MDILADNERLDEVNDKIKLIQRTDGLTFGTDALLLASYIKSEPLAEALELGGGSGIISFLVATRGKARHVDCAEIQPVFAEIIRRNAKINNLSDKVTAIECDVRNLKNGDKRHSYDIVFSNPPYMKNNSGKHNKSEFKQLARHECNGNIEEFVFSAYEMLKFGGKFYCVYRPDRMTELFSAMKKYSLEPKKLTFVHAHTNSKPSMLLVMAVSGGKCSLDVTAPLILYRDGTNKFTEMTSHIYKFGSFKDLWEA